MATLTVTVTEGIVLNGSERGNSNTTSIASVSQVDSKIVPVATAEASLILFGAAAAAGTFADATLKYLRISNLDATNYITLRVRGASEEYFVKLEPKGSYILYNSLLDANGDAVEATAVLSNIDYIKAIANTSSCDVEVFAAA